MTMICTRTEHANIKITRVTLIEFCCVALPLGRWRKVNSSPVCFAMHQKSSVWKVLYAI